MSAFLSSQGSLNSRVLERDARLSEFMYKRQSEAYEERYDLIWPPGMIIGSGSAASDLLAPVRSISFIQQKPRWYGAVSCLQLSGITRDSGASPIAGVTVKAFTTSDDVKQAGPVTSLADGSFILCTQRADVHYILAQKDAAPDIQGISDNGLIPG